MNLKYIFIIYVAIVLSSCTKDFDKYQVDNSRLSEGSVVAEALLDPMIYSSLKVLTERSFRLHGELIQYTVLKSTATNNENHRYDIREVESDILWSNLYRWACQARHIQYIAQSDIENNINVSNNKAAKGIGNIFEVLFVSSLTDIFGDIPYSESLMINNNILKPKYDDQMSVYKELFNKLEEANSLLSGIDKITKDDILYHGDCKKWRKFGNSLYLRLLMRLSNTEMQDFVKTQINYMYHNQAEYPVFESIDDRAIVRFTGISPNLNYFESNTTANFEGSRSISDYLIRTMVATSDPRLDAMFDNQSAGGEWIGVPSGEPTDVMQKYESEAARIDKKWRSNSHYFTFMNYSEILFIWAEAAARDYISVNAVDFYYEGIKSSYLEQCDFEEYMDLYFSDDKYSQYISKSDVSYPQSSILENELEAIIKQKYIANFFVGFEAWCDYRRTGYPVLTIGSYVENDGVLPTRLRYPNSESSRNNENWTHAVENQGPDDMKTKIWWAK